ncbi:MAG: SDR family oxidoreductase [Bacteroidales bacterium]
MKTIFLTGGSTGIGRSIARLFYSKGYNVSFIDINEPMAMECVKGWEETRYLFTLGSVTERETLSTAVAQTVAKFGKIDSLIINCGIHRVNNLTTIEPDELDLMLDVNIKGVVNTLQVAMPTMISAGGGTIVVNVSDQAFIAKPNSFGYTLTKGAVSQIIKSVAVDYGSQGISISGVSAGTILTPLSQNLLQKWADREFNGSLERAIAEEAKDYPIGRIGNADEVAEMFYYLANAPFVTGSLHLIDGGLVAG